MLVAIVELTPAILVSNVAEVAALALVSARTDTALILVLTDVIADSLTVMAEAFAAMDVDSVLICVALICV